MDHKDVTIGVSDYRVGQMKAADGSWIYSLFVKRYREFRLAQMQEAPAVVAQPLAVDAPVPEVPTPEVGFRMSAEFLIEQLSRTELAEVQTLCLESCGRYNDATGTPKSYPILMADKRFAIPELERDGPTVLELTKESIAFNIAPYFPGAGSGGTTSPASSSPESNQD